MISTFLKACSSKLKTKVIFYRSYKKFYESDFLSSLKKENFGFLKNNPNQNYNLLIDKFLGIVNKHAPLKKKFVRGNKTPFMNKGFQKEIYVRSRLRNKFWVYHLRKINQHTKNREISASKEEGKALSFRKRYRN